jgi:hypothetical protein
MSQRRDSSIQSDGALTLSDQETQEHAHRRGAFQVQNQRPPLRCQATTVSALTMTNVERQSRQMRDRETQKRRSIEVNFGRFFTERCSTPI